MTAPRIVLDFAATPALATMRYIRLRTAAHDVPR
jgi:hypothetical protein